MKKNILRGILLFSVAICFSVIAQAQAPQPHDSFEEWLDREFQLRIDALRAKSEEAKVRINQRNITNQSETPSASASSTSLADKSSVSDLVGVALNLAGLSSKSSEKEMTSMSVTVTAYAFKAAASRRNPLDPAFYVDNRNYRNLSFTLGFDYPEGKEGDPAEKANIFGFKYLVLNERDATNPKNSQLLKEVSDELLKRGQTILVIRKDIRALVRPALEKSGVVTAALSNADFEVNYLGPDKWKDTYDKLSGADKLEIDKILQTATPSLAEYAAKVRAKADEIRKKPQVSLFFLTKQRSQERPDDYMAEVIADLGVAARWNLTFNGSFMYHDNKLTKDVKGGKFTLESQFKLTQDKLEGRMPLLLSVGADGTWMTDMPSMYRGQAKLTIPIADGIDFPISVTVANRTELINEKDVKGRFGFTFDIARLAQAFRGKFLGGN